MHPSYGPTQGGTYIVLRGLQFDDQAYCLIGNTTITPMRVDSTYMVCETLPHKAATNLTFELTFNNRVYTTSTNFTFSYYNDMQVNIILH